jgi:uncharacterized protein (TIGR02594 family)
MKAVYDVANTYLGLKEYPGARHNETIVDCSATVGHSWVKDDEPPWCASFVGAVLAQVGLPHTGKLNARSYLDLGKEVNLADAEVGDVVVFWRGSPRAATGHVGFYAGKDERGILVLGGNQGNAVSVAPYSYGRLLAVRRAPVPRTTPAKSTTVQASAVQVTSGVGAGLAAVGALDGTAQIVALVFAGVVILAAAWVMRERLRKWAGGDR